MPFFCLSRKIFFLINKNLEMTPVKKIAHLRKKYYYAGVFSSNVTEAKILFKYY